MTDKLVERLQELLPISDGGFRRRLVAGTIVTVSLFYVFIFPEFLNFIEDYDQEFDLIGVLTSPLYFVLLLLIIYSIGSLSEIFGTLFLVRAIGELLQSLKNAYKRAKTDRSARSSTLLLFYIVFLPVPLTLAFLKGLLGYTSYNFELESLALSDRAKKVFEGLPSKVQSGLLFPLSKDFDIAWKFIEDSVIVEDRKWLRTKNISINGGLATLNALFLVVLIVTADFLYKNYLAFLFNFNFALNPLFHIKPAFAQTISLEQASSRLSLVILFGALTYRGFFMLVTSMVVDAIEVLANQPAKSEG